jgi:heptosyltransferase-2
MHIAAAFNKPLISVWGNTVPAFGMYPYYPKESEHNSHTVEVKDLSCRPCSKLGFDKCPKEHFKCMNLLDEKEIVSAIHWD